ncbi:hypothetical protein P152DRAFT_66472 [Eremomyces bilateralis CBS 781.70]|uniref:Protein transport protein SEC31 n=1 Tax=Eremomyces bilateralis CBS 781.70 TaxID=1392243 RepID=A0A6G1G097_9PEZI|nr:uncharacterized protein P152DRAFT_66472 [Eremomyces bilateralis CBS 781.70]KAF1811239.1 hypothetical protein P152DRAFT_66472 [Eremomyces bilateralis CBS 781.70]
MVRLREIPRTATFAWSPGPANPQIATGTRAGAVDADFSNETVLELWDLALDDADQKGELSPVGKINTDSRFHDIAWGQPSEAHPRGLIAGALENGSLDLWDAEKLQNGSSNAFVSRASKHSGPIKTLQFNPFRPELLATAGAKGEVFLTDVNNAANSTKLSTATGRADDFDALDWNKNVPHILATGSSGGYVTIWDVKAKKENMTLMIPGRKPVSAVAWDPTNPTKLLTAIPSDQEPVILVWDLRNSNAGPERQLRAHDQGVLSVSWCLQDPDLLLSCGKDHRTICWNPHTGDVLGEFPVVTNWTFETKFHPHNPNILATAAFDGKIAVQTIQNTNFDKEKAAQEANLNVDAADFFASAQSQLQGVPFSLPKAPKWLERPVGASFGFGGKLVRFAPSKGETRKSTISISTFAVSSDVGAAGQAFEEAFQKGNLVEICESRISAAKSEEEKADWAVIETLVSSNSRQKLRDYLGFSTAKESGVDAEDVPQTNGQKAAEGESSFFDGAGSGDDFLSSLALSKGVKTNNPFQLYTGSESDADRQITKALMLGSFEEAVDICLKEDRMSDAFMIAVCGGQKCIDKTQSAYFKQKSKGPSYLRLLASIVGKNLWDVVHNANLENWKEVMATLCTFADETEFPDLCEALGDRLEESIPNAKDEESLRKDATFCFMAGSKLEKAVTNWAQELQEREKAALKSAETDDSFSIHAYSLQSFIEKVTVFRQVTNYQDPETSATSGWKLAPLYAKYNEYADIAASHGNLKIAEKYLDLLPTSYPEAELARSRVKQATRKAPAQQTQSGASRSRVAPTYPTAQAPLNTGGYPQPYQPTGSAAAAPPMLSQPSNHSYTPMGYQPPGQAIPPPQPFGYQPPGQQQPSAVPPPPSNFNSASTAPPPPRSSSATNWNDTPDFGGKPTPRRGTPMNGPPSNTYTPPAYGQAVTSPPPPMGSPFSPQQRATPPLAPPPRGPSRLSSPPTAAPTESLASDRPASSAGRQYAPPTQPMQTIPPPMAPPVARGPSPYQPPPSSSGSATHGGRYAPAPSPQPAAGVGHPPPPGTGPPPRGPTPVAPPPNPYATIGGAGAGAGPIASQPPPVTMGAPTPPAQPLAPPPRGPPPGGPPRAGPPSTYKATPTPPVERKSYPAGDRSHIPPRSMPIFEILSADMRRVKSKAPAQYEREVNDTVKRLDILFDHLNNEDLLKPDTVGEMLEVAEAVKNRNYDGAQSIVTNIMSRKAEEGGKWLVGVKRLVVMSRNTRD